jgi:hypothetical protein
VQPPVGPEHSAQYLQLFPVLLPVLLPVRWLDTERLAQCCSSTAWRLAQLLPESVANGGQDAVST